MAGAGSPSRGPARTAAGASSCATGRTRSGRCACARGSPASAGPARSCRRRSRPSSTRSSRRGTGPAGATACGETLTASTLGVANRTLPCGTLVTLRYRDRTVRVPVIDRGPFVAGRDYDLTWATKLALGAGDVTVIWASACERPDALASERQRELHRAARLGRRAGLVLEGRDPHAQQPHRARRRVGAQQLERDLRDRLARVGEARRACARA